MKFKVGDKIKGNHISHYSITNTNWSGKVLDINSQSKENLKVGTHCGDFWVNSDYFDLIEQEQPTYSIY
jgi:hypothetical protein